MTNSGPASLLPLLVGFHPLPVRSAPTLPPENSDAAPSHPSVTFSRLLECAGLFLTLLSTSSLSLRAAGCSLEWHFTSESLSHAGSPSPSGKTDPLLRRCLSAAAKPSLGETLPGKILGRFSDRSRSRIQADPIPRRRKRVDTFVVKTEPLRSAALLPSNTSMNTSISLALWGLALKRPRGLNRFWFPSVQNGPFRRATPCHSWPQARTDGGQGISRDPFSPSRRPCFPGALTAWSPIPHQMVAG